MTVSRLGRQIEELLRGLNRIGASCALIGGLALASHKVIRATQDIDLLAEAEQADEIDGVLAKLGYRCIHRSADAGNYLRGDERVDLLYASRPIARRLLAEAEEKVTPFGILRVVSLEALVGFKLQGYVTDRAYPFVADGGVQTDGISSSDPYTVLDDLMAVVEILCPVWPTRPISGELLDARL